MVSISLLLSWSGNTFFGSFSSLCGALRSLIVPVLCFAVESLELVLGDWCLCSLDVSTGLGSRASSSSTGGSSPHFGNESDGLVDIETGIIIGTDLSLFSRGMLTLVMTLPPTVVVHDVTAPVAFLEMSTLVIVVEVCPPSVTCVITTDALCA